MLPWWLDHSRRIFDHGIMIDYNSTDGSRELIKKFCPKWEIHTTRNAYFDSACIDREVEDYERRCRSWRMALNVTEFLYGNFQQLDKVIAPTAAFHWELCLCRSDGWLRRQSMDVRCMSNRLSATTRTSEIFQEAKSRLESEPQPS